MSAASRADAIRVARRLSRDVTVTAWNEHVRARFTRITSAARQGCERWAPWTAQPRVACAFGRTLSAASLLAAEHKGEERVSVELSMPKDACVQQLYAEAVHVGELRGRVACSSEPAPTPKLAPQASSRPAAVMPALAGTGYDALAAQPLARADAQLQVRQILYGNAQPVASTVNLQHGDITQDLAWYMQQSVQVQSRVHLECLVRSPTDSDIVYAGGMLLQLLPGGDPAELDRALGVVHELGGMAQAHAAEMSLQDLAAAMFPHLAGQDRESRDFFPRIPQDWFCRCSKDGFLRYIQHAGPAMAQHVLDEAASGSIPSLDCGQCNTAHPLAPEDLANLANAVSAVGGNVPPAPAAGLPESERA